MRGLIKRLMIVVAWSAVLFILMTPGIFGWYGLHDEFPFILDFVLSFFISIMGLLVFLALWSGVLQFVLIIQTIRGRISC